MYRNHSWSWIVAWWLVYRWETRLARKRMRAFKKYQKEEKIKELNLVKATDINKEKNKMKSVKIEDILNMLSNENEFCTCPIINKAPKWFCAVKDRNSIIISKAKFHKNSSNISKPRKLNNIEFDDIYDLYLRRHEGESVSKEAMQVTRNQVYWYGLINSYLEK